MMTEFPFLFGVNYSFKLKAVLMNLPRFPTETDSFLVLK